MLLSAQWYKNRLYPTLQQQSTEGKSLLSENKSTVRTYNIVSVTKLKLVLFGTNCCVTFLNINKVSDSLVAKILWYSNSTYCQRILNLPLSITQSLVQWSVTDMVLRCCQSTHIYGASRARLTKVTRRSDGATFSCDWCSFVFAVDHCSAFKAQFLCRVKHIKEHCCNVCNVYIYQ